MVPEIPLKIGNCQNNQAGSLTKVTNLEPKQSSTVRKEEMQQGVLPQLS